MRPKPPPHPLKWGWPKGRPRKGAITAEDKVKATEAVAKGRVKRLPPGYAGGALRAEHGGDWK